MMAGTTPLGGSFRTDPARPRCGAGIALTKILT